MKGIDILSVAEANDWVRAEGDDGTVARLIQSAYDYAQGAVDGFELKLNSDRFKRQLKELMLSIVTTKYDDRGYLTAEKREPNFLDQSIIAQLRYETYSESDL